MQPDVHKRYLEYLDRHEYFGGSTPKLDATSFVAADSEQRELAARSEEERDDEEEARFEELSLLLHRD